MSAIIGALIRAKQRMIELIEHDIEELARTHIPDYHFLDYKVSTFWRCEKSPIGMCVWSRRNGEFNNYCTCRYCGGPVERK